MPNKLNTQLYCRHFTEHLRQQRCRVLLSRRVASLFQVQQLRLESEEHSLKLEVTQTEAQEAKLCLEREKEQVRRELLGRVRELETLTEKLRRSEQQRRDAQQEAEAHERRNVEHGAALSEVRHKVGVRTWMVRRVALLSVSFRDSFSLKKTERFHSIHYL